jgi:hypothetical protein
MKSNPVDLRLAMGAIFIILAVVMVIIMYNQANPDEGFVDAGGCGPDQRYVGGNGDFAICDRPGVDGVLEGLQPPATSGCARPAALLKPRLPSPCPPPALTTVPLPHAPRSGRPSRPPLEAHSWAGPDAWQLGGRGWALGGGG